MTQGLGVPPSVFAGEDPEMLRNLSALLQPDPNDPTRPLRKVCDTM